MAASSDSGELQNRGHRSFLFMWPSSDWIGSLYGLPVEYLDTRSLPVTYLGVQYLPSDLAELHTSRLWLRETRFLKQSMLEQEL